MTHDSNGASPRRLTTEFGIPVPDNQNSLTAGEAGPILLQDHVLYRVMDPAARGRLIENLVGHMRGVSPEILHRQIAHFAAADSEYGRLVAEALGRPFSARAAAA